MTDCSYSWAAMPFGLSPSMWIATLCGVWITWAEPVALVPYPRSTSRSLWHYAPSCEVCLCMRNFIVLGNHVPESPIWIFRNIVRNSTPYCSMEGAGPPVARHA